MSEAASHEIFTVAIKVVGDPLRARTLAECLFWYQKAGHKIDGQPAVWKTGPELAKVLGVKDRTANAHLKRLAEDGFWRLVRKPRPGFGSPSPVTWFIPSEKGLAVLTEARLAAANRKASPTSNRRRKVSLDGIGTDIQMSFQPTDFQLPSLPSGHSPFDCPPGQKAEKAKSKTSDHDPGKKADEKTHTLIQLFRTYQVKKQVPLWDLKSKFPWQHMKSLADALEQADIDPNQWPHFVEQLHVQWAWVKHNLPKMYQNHSGNYVSPTARPLGQEASTVVQVMTSLWESEAEKQAKKALKTSSKF